MPAVGAGLCRPHIPAGREGRAGGGLGREGGGSATALRAPKSQCSVQGGRAPGRASPRPGAEALVESCRADDSGGQEVSHPGTGQVRGLGPPATPRTPSRWRGRGGRGWEGASLGAGTKPRCRCCQSCRSATEAPNPWRHLLMERASASAAAAEIAVRPSARAERLGGCGWLGGPEAWGLSGPAALPRPPVSKEPQQWQRVPAEGVRGSPRPSVPQKLLRSQASGAGSQAAGERVWVTQVS